MVIGRFSAERTIPRSSFGGNLSQWKGFANALHLRILDSYSSITIPQNTDLISTDKGNKQRLFTAKNPLEGIAVETTEFVTLKAEDGTPLYGKLHKPTTLDPNKKYPVLIYVYGGPHAQQVKNEWLADTYLWLHSFVENEQYIVFTLDNRGSENRGFAFESVIHRHLGETEIKDQLKGVEYLKIGRAHV